MESVKIARKNGFASNSQDLSQPLDWSESCFRVFPETEPARDDSGLLSWYVMDAACVLPPLLLAVEPGMQVLDMCAAPGGKSLILAEAIAEGGQLVVNDVSTARRKRMSKVIQNYVPEEVRQRISFSGHDASRWGLYHPDSYDRVLLDAPCSGSKSDASISKKLAFKQYSLLCAALMSVRKGGRIIYSTCTVSEIENDGVVARLFKRKSGIALADVSLPIGRKTDFGHIITPEDTGHGPIYLSALVRED